MMKSVRFRLGGTQGVGGPCVVAIEGDDGGTAGAWGPSFQATEPGREAE